jgi:hypothetical protein
MNTKSRLILSAAALAIAAICPVQALHAEQQSLGQPLSRQAVLSELTSKLDTRKSKVGDPVTAKTLNPLKLNDGTVLPKGTLLSGKVMQAQPKSSGGATLAILFDQVAMKGTDPMPVCGLLVAVAAAPSLADAGGSTSDLPLGSGGDSKGAMASMTGTSISDQTNALPPIKAGSSIKGVALNPTPAPDGASVLQSTSKDIKLDSGTRLEIGLLAAK